MGREIRPNKLMVTSLQQNEQLVPGAPTCICRQTKNVQMVSW